MRRAKWTVKDATARTAASSSSADAGARGSSRTSGRESASEISLRSISPAPRANDCKWMRDAGEQALASSLGDPSCLCEAHHAMAGMLTSAGEHAAAREHFEASLAAYAEQKQLY